MVSVGTGRPGNAERCSLWEENVCEYQDTWMYVQRDLKCCCGAWLVLGWAEQQLHGPAQQLQCQGKQASPGHRRMIEIIAGPHPAQAIGAHSGGEGPQPLFNWQRRVVTAHIHCSAALCC